MNHERKLIGILWLQCRETLPSQSRLDFWQELGEQRLPDYGRHGMPCLLAC